MSALPKLALFSLLILLFLLVSSCREGSVRETLSPPGTRPTEESARVVQPSSNEVLPRLLLPSRIERGGTLTVEAINESQSPFVSFPVDGDNCLDIKDSSGELLQLMPPLTCDVLTELIMDPGARVSIGSWDLNSCTSLECQQRELVVPGTYTVAVTVYPYPGGESIDIEAGQTLEVEFEVE